MRTQTYTKDFASFRRSLSVVFLTLCGFSMGLGIGSYALSMQSLLLQDLTARRTPQQATPATINNPVPYQMPHRWIPAPRKRRMSSSSSSTQSSRRTAASSFASSRPNAAQKSPSSLLPSAVNKPTVPRVMHPAATAVRTPVATPVRGPGTSVKRTIENMFPAFGHTVFPVSQVPNWGGMHAAAQWNRPYDEMSAEDLVPVPSYDMTKLLTPYKTLLNPRDELEVTRKLFYSTKYFGAYDLDAGEFTAAHPGVDLKLALGTPLGTIAGGRVHGVRENPIMGLHVIIEHRHPTDGVFYSIYGHLHSVAVREGEGVRPGQFIGTVGMTGNTSGPHVHLQIDRGHGEAYHMPYTPSSVPSMTEADRWVVHPIRFIQGHAATTDSAQTAVGGKSVAQ